MTLGNVVINDYSGDCGKTGSATPKQSSAVPKYLIDASRVRNPFPILPKDFVRRDPWFKQLGSDPILFRNGGAFGIRTSLQRSQLRECTCSFNLAGRD